jgi:hypothetical protein
MTNDHEKWMDDFQTEVRQSKRHDEDDEARKDEDYLDEARGVWEPITN